MGRGKDTKQRIFDISTELFSEKGYDNVSIKEIAMHVGVSEGAIYRHYVGKEEILDSILTMFGRKINKHLMSKREIDKYIELYTPRELLENCILRFEGKEKEFIIKAFHIIGREHYVNEKAKKILNMNVHRKTIECVKYVLDRLVELNKIPEVDTDAFSISWTRIVLYSALYWSSIYHEDEAKKNVVSEHEVVFNWLLDSALTGKI